MVRRIGSGLDYREWIPSGVEEPDTNAGADKNTAKIFNIVVNSVGGLVLVGIIIYIVDIINKVI